MPAGPSGSGPCGQINWNVRLISRPSTLIARIARECRSAQRETKPTPSPASTPDLIASVESSSITMRSPRSAMPALRSASSTTCRVPDPDSRNSNGSAASSATVGALPPARQKGAPPPQPPRSRLRQSSPGAPRSFPAVLQSARCRFSEPSPARQSARCLRPARTVRSADDLPGSPPAAAEEGTARSVVDAPTRSRPRGSPLTDPISRKVSCVSRLTWRA